MGLVAGGTTDDMIPAVTSSSRMPDSSNSPRRSAAYSSPVRSTRVSARQSRRSSLPANSPNTVLVLPMSTARSMDRSLYRTAVNTAATWRWRCAGAAGAGHRTGVRLQEGPRRRVDRPDGTGQAAPDRRQPGRGLRQGAAAQPDGVAPAGRSGRQVGRLPLMHRAHLRRPQARRRPARAGGPGRARSATPASATRPSRSVRSSWRWRTRTTRSASGWRRTTAGPTARCRCRRCAAGTRGPGCSGCPRSARWCGCPGTRPARNPECLALARRDQSLCPFADSPGRCRALLTGDSASCGAQDGAPDCLLALEYWRDLDPRRVRAAADRSRADQGQAAVRQLRPEMGPRRAPAHPHRGAQERAGGVLAGGQDASRRTPRTPPVLGGQAVRRGGRGQLEHRASRR